MGHLYKGHIWYRIWLNVPKKIAGEEGNNCGMGKGEEKQWKLSVLSETRVFMDWAFQSVSTVRDMPIEKDV